MPSRRTKTASPSGCSAGCAAASRCASSAGRPPTDGQRVPTISFVVANTPSESIVRHVDGHGIGIRFGDFYAKRLIESLGLQGQGGVVRVSMAHYNTEAEIDRLIRAFEEVIA